MVRRDKIMDGKVRGGVRWKELGKRCWRCWRRWRGRKMRLRCDMGVCGECGDGGVGGEMEKVRGEEIERVE